MLYAHTHAHTTAQTDTLAYAIKDTSLQVLVKRSALGACSMQNLEDPEIHSKGGQWVYTGTFWPRAQSQHSRSLLVSDCKAFVEGSQSRAEELEVLCPVAGPTGAPVSSPIFKAEFKTGFRACSPANSIPCYRAADRGESFFSRSLSAASHVC